MNTWLFGCCKEIGDAYGVNFIRLNKRGSDTDEGLYIIRYDQSDTFDYDDDSYFQRIIYCPFCGEKIMETEII